MYEKKNKLLMDVVRDKKVHGIFMILFVITSTCITSTRKKKMWMYWIGMYVQWFRVVQFRVTKFKKNADLNCLYQNDAMLYANEFQLLYIFVVKPSLAQRILKMFHMDQQTFVHQTSLSQPYAESESIFGTKNAGLWISFL